MLTYSDKARAVGRAGSAASHIKRYDIDRVYHKSMSGGHPRETLEATFDIVQGENARLYMIEAEILQVVVPRRTTQQSTIYRNSPLWYIRLCHTRLSESILDLCGVPSRASLRDICLKIFSNFLAPSPHELIGEYHTIRNQNMKRTLLDKIDVVLQDAGKIYKNLASFALNYLLSLFCPCLSSLFYN
jgi:hypothetical protein